MILLLSTLQHDKAKEFSEFEWTLMLDLYEFIRSGSKETFCQINENFVDFLEPLSDFRPFKMTDNDTLELNKFEHDPDRSKIVIKYMTLQRSGVRFTCAWMAIDQFNTLKGFMEKADGLIWGHKLTEVIERINEIIETKNNVQKSFKYMRYDEALKFSEREKYLRLDLYKSVRNGSKETFCQINDKVVDILMPCLPDFD